MNKVIQLPVVGWAVRPGIRCAHFLFWRRGRRWSACGTVERIEAYLPHRLRPLQASKPRCAVCEGRLAPSVAAGDMV